MYQFAVKSLLSLILFSLSALATAAPVNFATLGEVTLVSGANPWGTQVGDNVTVTGAFNQTFVQTNNFQTYLIDLSTPIELDIQGFGGPGSTEFSGVVGGTVNNFWPGGVDTDWVAGISASSIFDAGTGWLLRFQGGTFQLDNGANLIRGSWVGPASVDVPAPGALLVLVAGLLALVRRARAS